jgi:hypothetical protein
MVFGAFQPTFSHYTPLRDTIGFTRTSVNQRLEKKLMRQVLGIAIARDGDWRPDLAGDKSSA